jgi:hypothetical protein
MQTVRMRDLRRIPLPPVAPGEDAAIASVRRTLSVCSRAPDAMRVTVPQSIAAMIPAKPIDTVAPAQPVAPLDETEPTEPSDGTNDGTDGTNDTADEMD